MIKLISYEVGLSSVSMTVEVSMNGWTKPMKFVQEYNTEFYINDDTHFYTDEHNKVGRLLEQTMNLSKEDGKTTIREIENLWVDARTNMRKPPTIRTVCYMVDYIQHMFLVISSYDEAIRKTELWRAVS